MRYALLHNVRQSDQLVHELHRAVACDYGQVLRPAINQPGEQKMSGGWAELFHTRSQSSKGQLENSYPILPSNLSVVVEKHSTGRIPQAQVKSSDDFQPPPAWSRHHQ